MKVWTIYLEGEGEGFTTDYPDGFDTEVDNEIEAFGEKPWEPGEREQFNAAITALKPGQEFTRGIVTIKCTKMTRKEYDNMPEWGGW